MVDKTIEPQGGKLRQLVVLVTLSAAAIGAWAFLKRMPEVSTAQPTKGASQNQGREGVFTPAAGHWAAIGIEPVKTHVFRDQLVTEGKIAVDEDRSTPVFSPYSGRVITLAAKPGDVVT